MESVINQALGDIHRTHAFLRLHLVAENDFMHGWRRVRQVVGAFKALANIVRVEDGVFGGLAQSVGTVGLNIGERTHEHPEVAVKGTNTPDRMRAVVLKAERAIGMCDDHRLRQEWLDDLLDRDRAGTGASASVRRGVRLMQVEMLRVYADIFGADLDDERRSAGAVHGTE